MSVKKSSDENGHMHYAAADHIFEHKLCKILTERRFRKYSLQLKLKNKNGGITGLKNSPTQVMHQVLQSASSCAN